MKIKRVLKRIKAIFYQDNYPKYKLYGDLHWRWYSKGGWYKELVDSSLKPFDDLEKGSVLDIGSGDGLVDNLLLKKGFDVEGVEPTKEGVKITREKVPGMTVYPMTLENFIDQNNKMYDYLYSINTIEHVKKYTDFVKLMDSINNFAVIVTDNAELSGGDEEFHEKEFMYGELRDLFKAFKSERVDLGNDKFIGIKVFSSKHKGKNDNTK